MAGRVGFRKKRKGYTKTTRIMGECGSCIICRICGYAGPANVIESSTLGSGSLERCPLCKSLNFWWADEAPEDNGKAVQLSLSLSLAPDASAGV